MDELSGTEKVAEAEATYTYVGVLSLFHFLKGTRSWRCIFARVVWKRKTIESWKRYSARGCKAILECALTKYSSIDNAPREKLCPTFLVYSQEKYCLSVSS
jgi:hypothetical protein